MRIGELSARTGVSRRSLRYYEDQGLLVSTRSPSGQRHYDDDHVRRVALIQAFLAAGMSSGTIAEMVPCMTDPDQRKARRAMAVMSRERDRLSATLESLAAARKALDELIDVNLTYLADAADAAEGRSPAQPAQPSGPRPVPGG
ncbi:MerR family transcriptional regulator [Streptomyces hygroscopicus]|uniref:MerR family transcriptional regulator n=1 Tax=Streptomyces hygroscopicus TaxID=1912 RepID=UPI00099D68C4|nr:MerR family transcriptional regulator [Streptomyces hygroscopicus]